MGVFDWQTAWDILPALLRGLWVTVQLTGVGITIALTLGLVLAMMRRSDTRIIALPAALFIEFIRSTPLLVQLYFFFYVLPTYGVSVDAFETGAIGLGVHYATYTSEVYRSGIEGVARGQWEASTALNLSPAQTWTRVVLPQAVPRVIPALGNYLIAMFKDAPLVYAITVIEVLSRARILCSSQGICTESYTLVGVLFLVVSIPSSIAVRRLERRLVRQEA